MAGRKNNSLGSPSSGNPEPVERLIQELASLPGVGRRSAERIAFHVLKSSSEEALRLSRAIEDVKRNVKSCSICHNLTDIEPCRICVNPDRDGSVVMVVEQPRDLISLEQTGLFKGVYHVLLGRIDPLAGVEPQHLTVDHLLHRVDDAKRNSRGVRINEVILGMNPTMEGDTTSLYLSDQLTRRGIKVTRLARGLPSGSQLEFVSRAVLADAIQGRQQMES